MKLYPLLLLPLIGGYAFCITWVGSLFHAARENGHRLYFRAAFYGIWLIFVAFFVHVILYSYSTVYSDVLILINNFSSSETVSTTIYSKNSIISILFLSFLLGPLLSYLLNLPRFFGKYKLFRWFAVWERHNINCAIKNNDFEKLVAKSIRENKLIIFTLTNDKVYVGWAVHAPNPVQERCSVKVLPLLSGYRCKDTLEVTFTNDYTSILDNAKTLHLTSEDLEVVIPVSQIVTSHNFDNNVYEMQSTPKIIGISKYSHLAKL